MQRHVHASTTFVGWNKSIICWRTMSRWRYFARSYWADSTIVMQCWLVYENLQLLHSSMHKMPAFVWWLAPEPETISVQHSNNYIGC